MTKLGFYYDMEYCIGCRVCQIACKDKNNLRVGENYRKMRTFETGAYPKPGLFSYSDTCNHCAEAKCVKGCPTGAMHYGDDGTVQHDAEMCIGCQYCVWNCPYSVPQYLEEKNVVGKCDFCKDLRDKGENPACVDACTTRVLKWGDIDELRTEHDGENLVSELPILPAASITKPSILIKPRAIALQTDYREKKEV